MATSTREAMIRHLDEELSRTRRTLERVPDDRWNWAPHEKSMPMGRLATHIATLAVMVPGVLTTEVLDITDRRANSPTVERAADLVPVCEELYGQAREALVKARDDDMDVSWAFMAGPNPIAPPMPRYAALTTFFFDHLIHHRAQLGVYLRLCGIPVPSIYGPSADEGFPS